MRSLQATYLKFAECVDILVQVIYTKFKHDRVKDRGDIGCTKMEKKKNYFISEDFMYCIPLLFYSTMSKLPPSIDRDTDNNLLVQ